MTTMRLTAPPLSPEEHEKIARELTEAVVRLMSNAGGRWFTTDEIRERCMVHFTHYEPHTLAIGGKLMRERQGRHVFLELSDWGLNVRQQRKIAQTLTPLLARLYGMEADGERVAIHFHPYAPTDFALGGKLLADRIPWVGQIMKRIAL